MDSGTGSDHLKGSKERRVQGETVKGHMASRFDDPLPFGVPYVCVGSTLLAPTHPLTKIREQNPKWKERGTL